MKHLNTQTPKHPKLISALLGIWVFGYLGISSPAADRITATLVLTNAAGTTNGQTLTIVSGTTTVRTWTNSVYLAASQILTNSTAAGAATNLWRQLLATVPIGVAPIVMTGPTNLVLYGQSGFPLLLTPSAGWASVSYVTQAVTAAYTVRIPNTIESAAAKTNVASELVNWLNLSAATNQLAQASPALAQLLGTTNTQTVTAAKTFTGAVILSNAAGIYYLGTISNAANISGAINAISNGVWYVGTISNAAGITGNLGLLTNGLLRTPILISPITTNLVNYGDAVSSRGTNALSEQFGTGALATNAYDLAVGQNARAGGGFTTVVGNTANGRAPQSTVVGYNASTAATATNAIALGTDSEGNYESSVALGTSTKTDRAWQIKIGGANHHVDVPGGMVIRGALTNLITSGTNTFPAGSDLAFSRYALTSLANGNNAALPLGTNIFVEISGNSAAAAIAGLTAGPNRDGAFRIIEYRQTYTLTLLNESGVDPVPGNRLRTQTGSDLSSAGPCVALVIYNGSAARWDLVNLWSVESGISASTATNIFLSNGASLTNLNGANLIWPTNQASTVTIDLSKPFQGLATNNNVTITGFSGIDSSGTNCQPVTIVITNTAGSAAVKTIALPAGCVDLLNTGTIYNTNQGVLTIFRYPGMGTNFTWIGR
jgi:hypothetical protein